jgi:sulfate/thiosulfate transport system ATP-binding protein
VTTVDGRLVRPHDIHVAVDSWTGGVPVTVTRVVSLGFVVRVEARAADGTDVWAQFTRGRAGELDVRPGDTVHLGVTDDARTPVLS